MIGVITVNNVTINKHALETHWGQPFDDRAKQKHKTCLLLSRKYHPAGRKKE